MAVDLTPLTIITGLPGSGKTLFTLATVEAYAKREGFKVFYHGIPQLTLDWEMLDEPASWHTLPNKSIIVIDESQSTFPPRSSASAMPAHVAAANTLRHKSHMLVLITQHPMLIDGSIRKLCTRHYHVERFYGFQKSTIHEFLKIRDNCDKSIKGSIANHFVYPKEVFNWYKSADSHTIKKRIPARLFIIFLLPMVLIAAVWFFLKSMGDVNNLSAKDSISAVVPVSGVGTTLTFYDSLKPRLADFPHTAPRYDEITKPVKVPFPAACVASSSKCVCHTQQGSKITVSDVICRKIVSDGFFVDFNISEKTVLASGE